MYLSDYESKEINSGRLLKRIKTEGLEQNLKNVVLKMIQDRHDKWSPECNERRNVFCSVRRRTIAERRNRDVICCRKVIEQHVGPERREHVPRHD
jgi:hypothetical protein